MHVIVNKLHLGIYSKSLLESMLCSQQQFHMISILQSLSFDKSTSLMFWTPMFDPQLCKGLMDAICCMLTFHDSTTLYLKALIHFVIKNTNKWRAVHINKLRDQIEWTRARGKDFMDSEQQNSNSCRRQTLWLKTIVDNRLTGFNYPWRQATVTLTTNAIHAKPLFRKKIFWGGWITIHF